MGTVYSKYYQQLPPGQSIKDLLKARENVNVMDQGQQVVAAILGMWDNMNDLEKTIVS